MRKECQPRKNSNEQQVVAAVGRDGGNLDFDMLLRDFGGHVPLATMQMLFRLSSPFQMFGPLLKRARGTD